jgi:hypothetical protein
MNVRASARWLALTSVSLLVVLALVAITSGAAFSRAEGQPVDTETVNRLTQGQTEPGSLQATSDITGSNASLIATGILLDAIFYEVDLPVIMK